MPRRPDPAVAERLVDATTDLLAEGTEPTLRSVSERAGTSTMAVYTYFGGMGGLRFAVREVAFDRLAASLATLATSADPDSPADALEDLVASGAAYVRFALAEPARYLALFDFRADQRQPPSAAATFAVLAGAVERARDAGDLDPETDADSTAVRFWSTSHGLLMLVLTGALPEAAVAEHWPAITAALLAASGADPERAAAATSRARLE